MRDLIRKVKRKFERDAPVERNEIHPRSTEDVRQLGDDYVQRIELDQILRMR